MEEKIIVKSEQNDSKMYTDKLELAGIILSGIGVISLLIGVVLIPNSWRYEEEAIIAGVIGGVVLLLGIVLIVLNKAWNSIELVVTNKRVYGQVKFGKRVDLPIDSVSAISTIPLKGVGVSTSSGRIAFVLIKNRDEIIKAISDLIVERQNKAPAVTEVAKSDSADEIKKYKGLLDSGVITQEEFDAKKKQLLGL